MTSSSAPSGTHVRRDQRGIQIARLRFVVRVTQGPDKDLERDVAGGRLCIGTGADNEVVLTDPAVSRRHCEIAARDDRYVLRDLGSTNGTFVGGARVEEAWLPPEAHFRIGDTDLTFRPKRRWEGVVPAESDRFGPLLGASLPMRELFGLLARVAPTRLSCLLQGESGTGKELAARALHEHGLDPAGPFVVVDCGALAEHVLESELFGHAKGAFTGAEAKRAGLVQAAHGGTLFLDEIGELPLSLQTRLLGVLDRGEVRPVGADAPVPVRVRVVAATHRDVLSRVRQGAFREDLYYRLAEVVLQLPPLRERGDDVRRLAEAFITAEGAGRVTGIAPEAVEVLLSHPWAGNVRELRNVIRRACALSSGPELSAEDLLLSPAGAPRPVPLPSDAEELPLKQARERWLEQQEKAYLERLLDRCGGDLERAAEEADVHVKSFQRLLRKHGLAAPRRR